MTKNELAFFSSTHNNKIFKSMGGFDMVRPPPEMKNSTLLQQLHSPKAHSRRWLKTQDEEEDEEEEEEEEEVDVAKEEDVAIEVDGDDDDDDDDDDDEEIEDVEDEEKKDSTGDTIMVHSFILIDPLNCDSCTYIHAFISLLSSLLDESSSPFIASMCRRLARHAVRPCLIFSLSLPPHK